MTNRSSFDLIDLNNQWIWEEYLTEKISWDLKEIINKMISFSLNTRYQKVEEVIKDLDNLGKRKLRLSWQTLTTFGILGSIVLILTNKLDLSPPVIPIDNSTPVDESPPVVEKPVNNISSKSIEILEKEAIEGLILLTDIQDKYFSKNGEFLEQNPYLPFASGHLFRIQKLDDRHIAIIALATENNLRNFIVMIWGGKPDLPENREKMKNYKPKNDDWGVLASPNTSFSQGNTPQNAIY